MSDNPRYKKIWAVVLNIPKGSVCTYGDVARFAGYSRCARMVGTALGAAPSELVVPWYRVINAQGKISFPSGSDKAARQKEYLEAEGVVFLDDRVDLKTYVWQGDLDADLWRM